MGWFLWMVFRETLVVLVMLMLAMPLLMLSAGLWEIVQSWEHYRGRIKPVVPCVTMSCLLCRRRFTQALTKDYGKLCPECVHQRELRTG